MTWQSQTIALLSASLLRPFALAGVAWLALRLLKIRHPASRHAVWTAVLIGMILLPSITLLAPHWKLPFLPEKGESPAQPVAQSPNVPAPDAPIDLPPVTAGPKLNTAKAVATPSVETRILWCYFAGLIATLIYRVIGWALLCRVVLRSRALGIKRVRESDDVLTPVAAGVLRPSVILPAGWRDWSGETKRAVLAHEFAHLRRRDTLISAVARFAKCVFWFHPLAWWISRQLSELAELSCDAIALEKVGDPAGYSRILLGFADAVNSAGYRAVLPGLAMATRSGMSKRIDQIFEVAGGNMRKLSRPGIVLSVAGIPAICIAATVGLTTAKTSAPTPRRQTAPIAAAPAAPVELAQATPAVPPPVPAPPPPPPAPKPKFDVASIKPCLPGSPIMGRGGPTVAGNTSSNGLGGYFGRSPGRLNISCASIMSMVNFAYVEFGHSLINVSSFPAPAPQHIKGVPAWAMDARYTIEAETDDPVANGPTDGMNSAAWRLMVGPMLQSLLEDRFQLRVHRDQEETPMYALTVAKGGLKLKPMQPGDCAEAGTGPGQTPFGPITLRDKPFCGWMGGPPDGPNRSVMGGGVSMSRLADFLGNFVVARHVIDRTGIAGSYIIRLEYAPDESTPCGFGCQADTTPSDIPLGTSIFTALEQQLGLKLESIRAPQGYVVIDHVEKPSEN